MVRPASSQPMRTSKFRRSQSGIEPAQGADGEPDHLRVLAAEIACVPRMFSASREPDERADAPARRADAPFLAEGRARVMGRYPPGEADRAPSVQIGRWTGLCAPWCRLSTRARRRGAGWRQAGGCMCPSPHSGMHTVTVISTRSSGAFSEATVTVVRAGLLVGEILRVLLVVGGQVLAAGQVCHRAHDVVERGAGGGQDPGFAAASIQERLATGPRAGHPVRRLRQRRPRIRARVSPPGPKQDHPRREGLQGRAHAERRPVGPGPVAQHSHERRPETRT
jgi:hypothetical protein